MHKTKYWTLFILSFLWSAFCVFTLVMAAIVVYLPRVGDKAAWLCLLPSKIDSFPQQPFVRLAIDILQGRRLDDVAAGQKPLGPADRKGEN